MKAGVAILVLACASVVPTLGLAVAPGTTTPATSPPPTTTPSTTPGAITVAPAAPTTAPPTTVVPTTSTLPAVPEWVFNPDCARVVRPGDSISLLADEIGSVAPSALLAENGFGADHTLHPGDVLDVCVGNDINDLNGASRQRPATTLIADADPAAVMAQQTKLNELFGPYGMTPLAVDGRSGPLTRQQLCAARVLLGLPISRSDMAAGSDEEAKLLALSAVPTPPNAPTSGSHWALIDMTCQVFFAGAGPSGVTFIFGTSTGQPGYETRVISEATAFRFDPALDNDGWHDSSEFPSSYDNPLNGNMYKPIYFSDGQAIHGANNVPTSPASKGCTRLQVANHDKLLAWLGLDTAGGPVWAESQIGLTVSTQGAYLPDP